MTYRDLREIIQTSVRNRQEDCLYLDPGKAVDEALDAAERCLREPLPEWTPDLGYTLTRAGKPIVPHIQAPVTRELVVIAAIEKVLLRHEALAHAS